MKKQLIIIVPGIRVLSSWKNPLRKIIEFIAQKINVYDLVKRDYLSLWRKSFKGKNRKVLILRWKRLPDFRSLKRGEKKLLRLIHNYSKKYEIFLIGISLGGKIVFNAIKKIDEKKVKKVFLVAAAGIEDMSTTKIPVINFYSRKDRLAKIGSEIINPLDKSLSIWGKNIKNIELFLNHEEFCLNKKIKEGKLKGKRIIKIIKKMIK